MKIKLFRILNSMKVLSELGKIKDFDGLTALKISRNTDKLEPEQIKFDKIHRELITKLGEKKAGATPEEDMIIVTPENRDEYSKQVNEMVEQEIEVDILLLDPTKINGFSPVEILSIEWMFEIKE